MEPLIFNVDNKTIDIIRKKSGIRGRNIKYKTEAEMLQARRDAGKRYYQKKKLENPCYFEKRKMISQLQRDILKTDIRMSNIMHEYDTLKRNLEILKSDFEILKSK